MTSVSRPSTAQLTSTIQLARPFLTKSQIKHAQKKTIENFTTLETAMIYYQRYFLFNKFDTNIYYDIAITSIFIASKNEDTIKKLRDILIIANQIKNTFLTQDQLELYRRKILSLESKLLETISFDFRLFHVEELLIKISKTLKISKDLGYLAWLLAYDSYQTELALKIPPQSISIACITLALKLKDENCDQIRPEDFHTSQNSINEALLDLLELYINSYNYTNLASIYPDYQNKFVEIRIPMEDINGLKEQDVSVLTKDDYYNDRDFSIGERRYMLGNQRKRLYSEIPKN
ncbi:Cyclin-T1-4 [Wickerhamomyces ciferrii]|uniref:Cyclin-T1-4 n=1 Tax=Wickerhamomyces ciferrii (strain ATCC 14091 / BCRC 22168 / CBS 111 / JCM 3599 / NBRC 0793 / NRRL Y-1031 F-60-10) TaxID=1206466 RepID=K0KD87_WICCF|nr:Cyclin-T1-4 [Wickerhamomyces ciferrii]CCH40861.1 Cyclin-T1-4 [Wickerhamomyces ciferrii]